MPSALAAANGIKRQPVEPEVIEQEDEVLSNEPKLWSDFRNPFVFRSIELTPDVSTAEGAVIETKKGQQVIINLDFLVFKYARDIQGLGLTDDKEGWLELCENLWEGMQEQCLKDKESQLWESARALHKLNPSKSIEDLYQQLKLMTT